MSTDHVNVITRVSLFCAHCGMAMYTSKQITPARREVVCLQPTCVQYMHYAPFEDATVTHFTPAGVISLQHALDLNPQPVNH